MSAITKAVAWAVAIANDNSHGYDQANRWGLDYDCSSLLIQAWENAGVPVKTGGATYTGDMVKVFKACGFYDVTTEVTLSTGAGLKVGDVLWKSGHTEMVCEAGKVVGASINENGGTTGGATGDQTGLEIRVRTYYNYPWSTVLRYKETPVSSTWIAKNSYLTETEMQNNARIIHRYLHNLGWTLNAIAATIANFECESTISPARWQSGNYGNMSGGYGLAQWTPVTKFSNWAGGDWETNHDKQLDFLKYHFENPSEQWLKRSPYRDWSFSQYAASTADPYTLACVFCWNYEAPYIALYGTNSQKEALKKQRGDCATKWYNYLKSTPLPTYGNIPIWLLFKLKERSFK